MNVGQVFETSSGGLCEIIDYKNNKNVTVKFLDDHNHIKVVAKSQLISGEILNPYAKTVYGIGCIGVGEYKSASGGKHTTEHSLWTHMFSRCYSLQESCSSASYEDKFINHEWHNFQNFAGWCNSGQQGFNIKGWHLDKDLLVKGNKEYGPETCCFLPSEVNAFMVTRKSLRGDLPLGVSYGTSAFIARCKNTVGIKTYIGSFKTTETAFLAFKQRKEEIAKILAEKYRGLISDLAYNALMQYTVHISD